MIKSLSIKNFRGLDGLKVEDFGRVNLITGANNVGKTALLEAVLLASVAPDPTAILGIVFRREEPSLASNWGLFVSALPRIFSNAQIEKPIEIEFKVKNEAFKLQIEQLSDFKDVLPVLIGALGQANVNDQAVNTYKVLSFTKRQKQKTF